ncbi:MAG: hypothetical protein Q9217_001272 [Psora testacea]
MSTTKATTSLRLPQKKGSSHARRPSKPPKQIRGTLKALRPGQLSTSARMKSHIQFITTPTSDTPGTALLLHFDDKRYIFGHLHEGLQRAGFQSGFRFLKVKDFFLTGRTEWSNHGGILGMILTLADGANAAAASKAEISRLRSIRRREREELESQRRKKRSGKKGRSDSCVNQQLPSRDTVPREVDPTLRIHGGPNIAHTLATARSFIFRQGLPLDVDEFDEEGRDGGQNDWKPTFADNRVQVWAMPVRPTCGGGSDTSTPPVSPRKRSLGEYMSNEKVLKDAMEGQRPTAEDVAEQWGIIQSGLRHKRPDGQHERDQQVRHAVVNEMFKSKWRFDNLVETPLHQVELPATLFVRNSETNEIASYEGPLPSGDKPLPDINVLVRQPWPGALVEHLPPTKPSPVAMSYIVRNHKQRGKFKPSEAKRLKVPPGPLFSKLAQGLSVKSTDGNTITPDMVLEPEKEGGGVAIIDLPSREYIPNLFTRPEFTADEVMNGVGSFIWLLGRGVHQDEMLTRFMDNFKDMKHIVSSPDVCANGLMMTSAAAQSLRHRQIDPNHYPPLHYNNTPQHEASLQGGNAALFTPAKKGLTLPLEPTITVVVDGLLEDLDESQVQAETPKEVLEFAQTARNDIAAEALQVEQDDQDLPSPDAEIICLGTGSALPSLHRNVSATLLRIPGCGSYLLDCGENTLGQLQRMYSPAELQEVLRDLKLIWISHLHADHHLGTTSVIKAWYHAVHGKDDFKRPRPAFREQLLHPEKFLNEGRRLFVVGHPYLMRWLDEYSSVEDFGYDQIVPLAAAHHKKSNTLDQCSLKWNSIDVGFNTSMDPRIGFKFSYSGDCRPSKTFAEIGKGSTVLLHEATFDDEMKSDALAKKHSTISEAIGVGVAMGASRVLLTHFSQRYATIPNMDDLDKMAVKLEDAEDVSEDSAEGIDAAVDVLPEAHIPINNRLVGLDEDVQEKNAAPASYGIDGKHADEPPAPVAPLIPSPANTGMKVGVAFDYMRIKVKELAHLERYTPALRELYREKDEEPSPKQANRTSSRTGSPIHNPPNFPSARKPAKSDSQHNEAVKAASSDSNDTSMEFKMSDSTSTASVSAKPAKLFEAISEKHGLEVTGPKQSHMLSDASGKSHTIPEAEMEENNKDGNGKIILEDGVLGNNAEAVSDQCT